jgi:hypothetical protein
MAQFPTPAKIEAKPVTPAPIRKPVSTSAATKRHLKKKSPQPPPQNKNAVPAPHAIQNNTFF